MKRNLPFVLIFIAGLLAVAFKVWNADRARPVRNYSKEVVVMDRHLLSRSLISIFGDEAKPIVLKHIFELGATLGGSCDFYAMAYDSGQNIVDPFLRCPAMVNDINAPMFVKSNTLRQAAVEKACRQLTSDDKLVAHALRVSRLEPRAELTAKNIEKLYFTFYKAPSDYAADAKGSNWNRVAYSLCISPGWQTL